MKKVLVLLLTCCMALTSALLPAMAEDAVSADDETQLHSVLSQHQGADAFDVGCGAELFERISADRFAPLQKLCYLAGMKEFSLRYSSSGTLQFSQVVWMQNGVAAECETEADVRDAVSACLQSGGSSLTLLCSDALFDSLYTGRGMYRLLAGLGIESFSLQGNSLKVCFLNDLVPMTVPFAGAGSISEAGERIAQWRESAVPAFNLVFDKDVYDALSRDDYRLIAFLGGVENYSLSYNTGACMLMFTDVTYADAPCLYCVSDEEVVAAIRAMGAQGASSFQIKLDQPTYDAISAKSFAHLYDLQAQAGMTAGDLRFSGVARVIRFDNAVIQSDTTPIDSLEAACAHVAACAARGDADISLLLTPPVYAALMDGANSLFASDARIYDLLGNVGIFSAEQVSANRFSGTINLQGVRYYAGTDILRAVERGDTSGLSRREQEALEQARALAAACLRDSEAATALAIHDALCERITYDDDVSTDEDDCCIGALLSGRANCDGYADAMLLVGRLAGLNVRYQHGDSVKGGLEGLFSTHMWNLIELDGSWRMLDLTWDDFDRGLCRLWFDIGEDRAALSHAWSREMTVPLLAQTDPAGRPVYEAFVKTADEAAAAVAAAQAAGETVFDLYLTQDSDLTRITFPTAAMSGLTGEAAYVYVDSLRCLHVMLQP